MHHSEVPLTVDGPYGSYDRLPILVMSLEG